MQLQGKYCGRQHCVFWRLSCRKWRRMLLSWLHKAARRTELGGSKRVQWPRTLLASLPGEKVDVLGLLLVVVGWIRGGSLDWWWGEVKRRTVNGQWQKFTLIYACCVCINKSYTDWPYNHIISRTGDDISFLLNPSTSINCFRNSNHGSVLSLSNKLIV